MRDQTLQEVAHGTSKAQIQPPPACHSFFPPSQHHPCLPPAKEGVKRVNTLGPCTSTEEPDMDTENPGFTLQETPHQSPQPSLATKSSNMKTSVNLRFHTWRSQLSTMKLYEEVGTTWNFHVYFCGPPCWTEQAAKAYFRQASEQRALLCVLTHSWGRAARGGWAYLLGSAPGPAQGKSQKVSNASPTSPGRHIKEPLASRISGMHAHRHGALLGTPRATPRELSSDNAEELSPSELVALSGPCLSVFFPTILQTCPIQLQHKRGDLMVGSLFAQLHPSCPNNIPESNPEK